MKSLKAFCPICRCKGLSLRYPRAVCLQCIDKHGTKSADGTDILFTSAGIWGGVRAISNNEPYNYSTCYISNLKVFATEARFGGIVFQPV